MSKIANWNNTMNEPTPNDPQDNVAEEESGFPIVDASQSLKDSSFGGDNSTLPVTLGEDAQSSVDSQIESNVDVIGKKETKKRRKRRKRTDATEQRLLGRRRMCKGVESIAPDMLKTVKMRIMARHLDSKRGMDDAELTERIKQNAALLVEENNIEQNVL
jgi:hypothetical protein